MSATGRGGDRTEEAFTPYPLALACCQQLRDAYAIGPVCGSMKILEPSAGKGAFVKASLATWPDSQIDAADIYITNDLMDMDGTDVSVRNRHFLFNENSKKYDLVIGNPPYGPIGTNNAEKHVRKGVSVLTSTGILAYVLRLNFLAGIERGRGLWREVGLDAVFVLDKRPSFRSVTRVGKDGKKKTSRSDACDYGLFVFRRQLSMEPAKLQFLNWSGKAPHDGPSVTK